MRIYLAGPMRGYPDNNNAAFRKAAEDLRWAEHKVWSPAEHDEGLTPDSPALQLRAVFRRDLDALLQQDAIVLLPGWESSAGAQLERHAAEVCGIPVLYYDPNSAGYLKPDPSYAF